jgi:hypothetical protein
MCLPAKTRFRTVDERGIKVPALCCENNSDESGFPLKHKFLIKVTSCRLPLSIEAKKRIKIANNKSHPGMQNV